MEFRRYLKHNFIIEGKIAGFGTQGSLTVCPSSHVNGRMNVDRQNKPPGQSEICKESGFCKESSAAA
ncbi:MAG: hypothetical protein CBB71_11565 [Rhodopirellula sp. TMED11]|nr:MAG: hypothetical protein CBB71_16470 [Rhodopirellula sp. TMED11]OUT59148.1 MAG: hypothetical protein CBB71_11565 [Rhodopirellula sp. TMED11]